MWIVENRTPYAADRTWIRDKDGSHHWVVVVKATFSIRADGNLELADEQLPPLHAAEYNGEDGISSVRYEADLVGPKPSTDVIVNGHAYAPHGRPAVQVPVSLRVNGLQKMLFVRGENLFYRRAGLLLTSDPQPFIRMPIVYERGYGGYDRKDPDPSEHRLDSSNPVGVGFATRKAHLIDTPGPNVVYPKEAASAVPAGFGAIAAWWQPRLKYAGTYDADWMENRKPLLPTDFDDRFFMASPEDQRLVQPLLGGTHIEITHMTPEGRLIFEIPRIRLAFTTHISRARHEHRSSLASVVIEPDERRVVLSWHTHLKVKPRDVDYVDRTVVVEKEYLQ